jgi:hypothetical protein
MTITTNQRCCLQIWVVTEVIIEITTEVLAKIASRERVSVINTY